MITIKKIFNTTVSVKEGASRSVLRGIIQYDTLNEVNIRLSDGSKAFDYTGYTNIIFKVLKADGTAYIDSEGENVIATSPVDGIITVILTGQSTTVAGLCQSVIEVYSGEGKMTTARFNYEVFEALGGDDGLETTAVDESENYYPVFQNLMADLSALEASIEEAEAKRVAAENARVALETGYVARAEKAAETAEMWAKASQDVSEGDFATRAELEAVRAGATHIYEYTLPMGGYLSITIPPASGASMALITVRYRMGAYVAHYLLSGYATGGIRATVDTIVNDFGQICGVNAESNNGPGMTLQNTETQDATVSVVVLQGGKPIAENANNATSLYAEWQNPPMRLGVEYRTTKRYLGKPVYAKLFQYAHPTEIRDNMAFSAVHGISHFGHPVRFSITSGNYVFPYFMKEGYFCGVRAVTVDAVVFENHGTYFSAGMTFNIELHYTKSTD